MKTKVQKRGNILVVRIPRDIAQKAGVHVDDALEAEVVRGKIVLTPAKKEAPANYIGP